MVKKSESIPIRKAMLAIAAFVHWRKFAIRKARLNKGYCASDRLIGNRDKLMKVLLLHHPLIWCYGLTIENSSIPEDLCDWLNVFSETEHGKIFIKNLSTHSSNNSNNSNSSSEIYYKIAKLPNLFYSLIKLDQHELLMKLPMIRKSIVKPHAFQSDFWLKSLKSRKLMESTVEFIEFVSNDIHLTHLAAVRLLQDEEDEEEGIYITFFFFQFFLKSIF